MEHALDITLTVNGTQVSRRVRAARSTWSISCATNSA